MAVHLTVNHGNGALPQRRHDFQGEEVRRRRRRGIPGRDLSVGVELCWEKCAQAVGPGKDLRGAHTLRAAGRQVEDHAAAWHVAREALASLAVLVEPLVALRGGVVHVLAPVHHVVRPKH